MGIFKIAALGVDLFQSLMSGLNQLIPISFGTLYVIVNVILLSFSLLTARLGVSTYDAIAIVMSEKWKLGKFKYIRVVTDVTCVILGIALFLLGKGDWKAIPTFVGVGTIVTAFFMGPLIQFFNDKLAEPF